MKYFSSPKKFFTLIEILIVIAIIGIIISVSLISFSNVRQKSRDTKRISDIQLLQKSLEDYYRNEGSYPETLTPGQKLVGAVSSSTYMQMVPQNPSPKNDGACPNSDYAYILTGTGYMIDFCLSESTAQLTAGQKCATPRGIMDRSCFTCGDSIFYGNQLYKTVEINSQCWFRDSLNYGSMINASNEQNNDSLVEKYCYNNDINECNYYGALYQWSEVMNLPYSCNSNPANCQDQITEKHQGICPSGWHIPTNQEWLDLVNYLGGSSVAGGKLKSTSTAPDAAPRWSPPNTAATNESGFNALPTNYRQSDGSFFWLTYYYSTFWTSSVNTYTPTAYLFSMGSGDAGIANFPSTALGAFGVRCLKN